MKKKLFLVLIAHLCSLILIGQSTTKRLFKYQNTQTLKEDYAVLTTDTIIKHGMYRYYFINQKLRLQGNYVLGEKDGKWEHYADDGNYRTIEYYKNGAKTGIWLDFTSGEVVQRYDQDKQKTLPPLLPKVYIEYPASGRETEIEGMVEIKFLLDEHCEILDAIPIKTLGPDFEQAVIKGYRLRHAMMKKYKVEIPGCDVGEQIFSVNFALN